MEASSRKAQAVLQQGLKSDSDLLKDLATVSEFVSVAASGKALGGAAAIALVLKGAGASIAALSNLIGRFRSTADTSQPSLSAYDEFTGLLYLTVVKAYLDELEEKLTELAEELAKADGSDDPPKKLDVAAIKQAVATVNDASLTYLFAVTPLTDESPLLEALGGWLTTLLQTHGLPSFRAHMLTRSVEQGARARFKVFLASEDEEARWMRNFLALSSESDKATVLSDLRSATEAIRGWLDPANVEAAHDQAWVAYRKVLRELPDVKATMYNEAFGVSRVFQSPVVDYHVARSVKDPAPVEVQNVGRLLGALVSNRTPGRDLIILAGGPGSGKSTLCRVFASELAASSDAHPVFLQLRRLREGDDIPQFIEDQLQQQALITKMADLLTLPNVVVILDGFDELVAASRSRLRQFFNTLQVDMESGVLRNAKVVVSGRDTLFPGGRGLPSGSHVLSLKPLDATRVAAWGERWRAQHETGRGASFHPERYLGKPNAAPSPLHHLVTWPLTLHLVARVHTAGGLPDASAEDAEIDKAYLYRSILSETANRQTEQTSGEGRPSPEKSREFLRKVAWLMYTKAVDSLDVADVTPVIDQEAGVGFDASQLAELAVLNAPELSKGEETGFEFVHKSFSEFLVAEVLALEIERSASEVPGFDSEASAWRMSDDDAVGHLGLAFGQRLLPAEVQEMLEPMLGGVRQFRKGTQVEERVPQEERQPVLEAIVRRAEALYCRTLTGCDLTRLDGVARDAPSVTTPIEALANYIAGLALVGTAAARQMSSERRFDAEQGIGGLWRFLSLCHAGNVTIDPNLSRRLFGSMTVAPGDSERTLTEVSLPWQLALLKPIEGFDPVLEKSAIEAAEEVRNRELLLMGLIALLYRISGAPLDGRWVRERWYPSDLEELAWNRHLELLAKGGLVMSSRQFVPHPRHVDYDRYFREVLDGHVDIEQLLYRLVHETRGGSFPLHMLVDFVRGPGARMMEETAVQRRSRRTRRSSPQS